MMSPQRENQTVWPNRSAEHVVFFAMRHPVHAFESLQDAVEGASALVDAGDADAVVWILAVGPSPSSVATALNSDAERATMDPGGDVTVASARLTPMSAGAVIELELRI